MLAQGRRAQPEANPAQTSSSSSRWCTMLLLLLGFLIRKPDTQPGQKYHKATQHQPKHPQTLPSSTPNAFAWLYSSPRSFSQQLQACEIRLASPTKNRGSPPGLDKPLRVATRPKYFETAVLFLFRSFTTTTTHTI